MPPSHWGQALEQSAERMAQSMLSAEFRGLSAEWGREKDSMQLAVIHGLRTTDNRTTNRQGQRLGQSNKRDGQLAVSSKQGNQC